MKVGDMVRLKGDPHESLGLITEGIGIIVKIDDGCYEVHFADGETMTDLLFSELEVANEI